MLISQNIDKLLMNFLSRLMSSHRFLYTHTHTQFYETEAFAPLCETQSAQSVLPPSYEDVMAAEKAILKKYAKICTSTKCCEHSQLNRSNGEHSTNDDGANDNIAEHSAANNDDNNAKPDAVSRTCVRKLLIKSSRLWFCFGKIKLGESERKKERERESKT